MNPLSAYSRPSVLSQLQEKTFDLLVIGGGITGAGIALDAASRGLTVALVEKNDFASGTSSRSTKLIHGGLRYLKQLELSLVREVGRERAIVHNLAPHLVLPEKMLLPLVEGGTYGKLSTSFGLAVYDFLANVEDEDKRVMHSREETLELEPLLRKDIVKGGGFYAEYRTDDARLTIEIIKTASKYGALSLNYIKATDFMYENGTITGVNCHDELSNTNFTIQSKYVVNAAGPWVDKIRKQNNSLSDRHIYPTKGVHIVVPHERFPIMHTVYFDVPDGRMIFAVRRHRVTYIGTTDTPFEGDLNLVPKYQEDVDYLLEAVNNMFPTVKLAKSDVESSWAGLRPLIFEEGKSSSELSRKDEIFESETGLISIAGGKLTGYRKMSERIVNLLTKKYARDYNHQFGPCTTDTIILSGGPFADSQEVKEYKTVVMGKTKTLNLLPYYVDYLVNNYGKQTSKILEQMKNYKDEALVALTRAELWYTVQNELVFLPMDFFLRRTGRLYFNIPSIKPVLEPILKDFKQYFGWDESKLASERKLLEKELYEAANFEYSKGKGEKPETAKPNIL